MQLRGRGSFRRGSGLRSHSTKNRYELVFGPTTGGLEAQNAIALGVDTPTNRSTHVRAGSTLTSIVCTLHHTAVVAGKHQALMLYKPAAENVATAIAAYWDITDPLTEEGVKIRRLQMSRCWTKEVGAALGETIPTHTFRWKGQKHIYDGDEISIDTLDATATTWHAEIWLTFKN